jgi:hypothetical protein
LGVVDVIQETQVGQIFDAVSVFEFRQQLNEDFGRGECVTTGAMPAGNRDREVIGDCVEPVVEQFRQSAT